MWPFKKKEITTFLEAFSGTKGLTKEWLRDRDPEWWAEYRIAPIGTALIAFSERNPGALPNLDAKIARGA